MKTRIGISFLLCYFCALALLTNPVARGQTYIQVVGPEARWEMNNPIMKEFHKECGALSAPYLGECFVSVMQRSGASPQAVAFTRQIGNEGYLHEFRETGRVDVAYVDYPFRANENHGCFLVNGHPLMIDVDDLSALPTPDLRKDKKFLRIVQRFPNVTLWPGDRFRTAEPTVTTPPGGGQRFIVPYRLTSSCRACSLVGWARFSFDFDQAGKFSGRKFLGIEEVTPSNPPIKKGKK